MRALSVLASAFAVVVFATVLGTAPGVSGSITPAVVTNASTAPVVDIPIPNGTAGSPSPVTGPVTWGLPMRLRHFTSSYVGAVGTDEADCTEKDASRNNVGFPPTRGFIGFNYTLPRTGYYAMAVDLRAPDSLANSFWAQFELQPNGAEWGTAKTTGLVEDLVTLEGMAFGQDQNCFGLSAGAQYVRFYAREAGASIARLRIGYVGDPILQSAEGCQPCTRRGGDVLTLQFDHLCDPGIVTAGFVRVGGKVCENTRFVASDTISCNVPPDATEDADGSLALTLHAVLPGDTTPTVTMTAFAFDVEPKEPFPVWAIIVIVVFVVGLVAVVLYAVVLRPWLAIRHAPRDAERTAIAVASLPKGAEIAEGFPDYCTELQSEWRAAVRSAANASGCYVARSIGGYASVVACKSAQHAAHFASALHIHMVKSADRLAANARASSAAKKKGGAADGQTDADLATDRVSANDAEARRQSMFARSQKSKSSRSMNTNRSDAKLPRRASRMSSSAAYAPSVTLEQMLRAGVAIDIGAVRIVHDEDHNTFDYHGAPVDAAAMLADSTQAGQTLLTDRAIDSTSASDSVPTLSDGTTEMRRIMTHFMTRRLGEDAGEGTDGDGDSAVEIYSLDCGAYPEAVFSPPKEGDGGGSLAAQLKRSTGGVAAVKATVLLFDPGLPARGGGQTLAALTETIRIATDAASGYGGVAHGFEGTRLVFSFNAAKPVVGHQRKAALAAAEIQRRQFPVGAAVCGSIATGIVMYGTLLDDAPVMLSGAPVDEAHELLSRFDALRTTEGALQRFVSNPSMERVTTSDKASSGKVMTRADKTSSRGSNNSSKHTASMAAGGGDRLYTGAMAEIVGGVFMCSGSAFLDLDQAVQLIILDADVTGAFAAQSATAAPRDGVIGSAAKPQRKLRDLITLAAVVGYKETLDSDEWQYDLAAIEAKDPCHKVSAAFQGLLRGDPSKAAEAVQEYPTSELAPREIRRGLGQLRLRLSELDNLNGGAAPTEATAASRPAVV